MNNELITKMETFIIGADGNINHARRVLHISRLLAEKENMGYDDNILAFVSYFHDVSAYPPYAPQGLFDHALESSKLVPDMASNFGFTDEAIRIIVEATKYHDKFGMGKYNETQLIRNSDGIDYLGFMAVARDFVKFPKDMRKAIEILKKRKSMFVPLVDLPYAKELIAPRIRELDEFIIRFEEESFGIY